MYVYMRQSLYIPIPAKAKDLNIHNEYSLQLLTASVKVLLLVGGVVSVVLL